LFKEVFILESDLIMIIVLIFRLESCKSREGANLEYLKNVTLSYFLTADDKIRKHMVNAIAAVLKFTDSETEKAIKSLSQSK